MATLVIGGAGIVGTGPRYQSGLGLILSLLEAFGLSLEDLLPHRGRMVLIDEVLAVDRVTAVTRCIVKPSWPLAGDGGIGSLILVELAAQTAGVCNGWDRIKSQGLDSDKTGYLVGIKRARFAVKTLTLGQNIIVNAENTYSFASLREVDCIARFQEHSIAEITLQLFQVQTENGNGQQ
jgi:predicted hotdog family 3-hydroxylacyl-ACP dehydratase